VALKKIVISDKGVVEHRPTGVGPVTNVEVDFSGSTVVMGGGTSNFASGTVDFGSSSTDFNNSTVDFTSASLDFSATTMTGALRLTTAFHRIEGSSTFDSFRVKSIVNGGTFNHVLFIPDDFVSLHSIVLAFIPQGNNASAQITITYNHPLVGEDIRANEVTSSFAYAALNVAPGNGTIHEIDIGAAGAAGTLRPGSWCGFTIANDTLPTISVIGSALKYYREL
jgi:hypothetical protein